MKRTFTFLGSLAHYDADGDSEGFRESYCCQASDDYCVDWNDDDPTHGFVIFRGGVRVECSNMTDVGTAIIMQEVYDLDTFEQAGICVCQNCGGYWIKGDIPTRHSLGCRHETREEHKTRAIDKAEAWYESYQGLAAIREVNGQWEAVFTRVSRIDWNEFYEVVPSWARSPCSALSVGSTVRSNPNPTSLITSRSK